MGRFVPRFTYYNGWKNKGDDILGVLCIFLLIACYFDYCRRRIPNGLLGTMLASGILICIWREGTKGILHFGCKMAVVILFLYLLFKIGTLGAGDVKLFGVCAGYFPGNKILYFLFFSLLIAAVVSILKILAEHNAKERICYLSEYLLEVARSGNWQLYISDQKEMHKNSICLAGPVLGSVLLYIGGVF